MKKILFLWLIFTAHQSNASEFNTSISVMTRPGLTARGAFGYENWYVGLGPSQYKFRDENSINRYEIGSLLTLGYQRDFQVVDRYALELKGFTGVEQFRDRTTSRHLVHQVGIVGAELSLAMSSQTMPPQYPSIPTVRLSTGLGLEGRILNSGRIHAGETQVTPLAIYLFISTSGRFLGFN